LKYSAQLTLYDEKQDVFCAHGTVHTEHYANSLVVNNTILSLPSVKWVSSQFRSLGLYWANWLTFAFFCWVQYLV